MDDLGGDSVEFGLTFNGDDSGELLGGGVLVSLEDLKIFEGLEGPSEDLTETSLVLVSEVTSVLVGAENVLKGGDTSVGLKVDLSG